MKNFKIIYLWVLISWGCNQNGTNEEQSHTVEYIKFPSQDTLPKILGDFSIYEHDLSLYSKKYLMRITPTIDSVNHRYQSNLVLTQNSDTIFNKEINIDSFSNTIIRYNIKTKSADHPRIATHYELREVLWQGLRTDDLFFQAHLKSKDSTKDLYVKFQVTYLHEIGKLFVNGFSRQKYGGSMGNYKNEKNRKFPPQIIQ
ncbi:MAG: hypothetical protein COA58_00165 [Bacteroidetes bacterium]|nr:MAG: hypothetical protein COA58_00165 [Bacteroidota bacterium]